MDTNNLFEPLKIKKSDVEEKHHEPENSAEGPINRVDAAVNLNAFDFPHERTENHFKNLSSIIRSDNMETFKEKFNLPGTTKNPFQSFEDKDLQVQRSGGDVEKEVLEKHEKFLVPEKNDALDTKIETLPVKENNSGFNPVFKKIINLPEGYTDSSHSSSSELQSSAIPFESSSSSLENTCRTERVNFENALLPNPVWRDPDENSVTEASMCSKPFDDQASSQANLSPTPDISITLIKNNTETVTVSNTMSFDPDLSNIPACVDLSMHSGLQTSTENDKMKSEVEQKTEESKTELSATVSASEPALPVLPPAPRKRGRPRKQVLPNPNPLDPNSTQTPTGDKSQDLTRSTRSERRTRKKKFEGNENEKTPRSENTPKRRYTPRQKTENKKKKKKPVHIPRKRGPKPGKKHAELENIQNFEEETRMSASEGQGGFNARSGALGDESQNSFIAEGPTKSNINKKGRMEIMTDGCKPVTVQQIVEYYWPPPSSLPHGEKPEGLMIQEQITEYLGVKSFKRKYPSIKRRPVEMEERNYLQENGFVTEKMCDMGLTAVFSADIIEIMYNDFPHKFEEYRKYSREKKAKEQRALREKQAAERADMDPLKEAVESAQLWNAEFNKTRREKRASCFDLQTFTVHFPANRYKMISLGKPGNYPIALIPGQNTDYYKKYTSNELKYFPLNTVLYGPLKPNERHFPLPSGSDGSQSEIDDDSSSSDESSSTSSEETQDTEETNSTADEDVVTDTKSEKDAEEKVESVVVKTSKENIPKTPRGRGRGRISTTASTSNSTPNGNQTDPPKKRLGRPPKLKLAAVKLKRLENEKLSEHIKEEKPDTALRVIIHTCKMCHEEESKNKNGEFEAFIECAQCKGKIHPSCIDLTAEMIPKISSYGWQCTDCKSCVKCEQSTNEDKMIFCDQCDRGYHIYCVGLNEVPSGNYICHVCKPLEEEEMIVEEESPSAGENVENSEPLVENLPPEVKEEVPEVKTEVKVEEEPMDTDKTDS